MKTGIRIQNVSNLMTTFFCVGSIFMSQFRMLRVPERTTFHLCVLLYRCLNGTASYIAASR